MRDVRSTGTYEVEPDFASRQAIIAATGWLVGTVTVGLVVQAVLLVPELSAGIQFLSYGRLRGVHDSLLVFGWLTTAGFAAIFALLPRLTESQLHNEVLGASVVIIWSLLLLVGAGGILAGFGQGRPLAQIPPPIAVGLGAMMIMVFYNAAVTATRRRERTLYVSAWYLLAGAMVLPVVYVVGNLPMLAGMIDAITGAFYVSAIELLWLLPIAFAVAHYVVPVETGNPLFSPVVAKTSFWTLMFAGGWTGHRFFVKGPGPEYLEAIAVGMTIVLFVPVVSAAYNLFATGSGRWGLVSQAYGLRFVAAGLGLLLLWLSLVVAGSIPHVSRLVGLTLWHSGLRHLALYGVFSSFAFALIYHVYPLLVGRDLFSRPAAAFHFWATLLGTVAGSVFLMTAGVMQGTALGIWSQTRDPGALEIVLRYVLSAQRGPLVLAAIAFGAVAVAQYVFAYNLFRTARQGPVLRVLPPTAVVGSRT